MKPPVLSLLVAVLPTDGADLAGFIRLSGTDGDATSIKTVVNLGFRVRALLPGRQHRRRTHRACVLNTREMLW